MAKLVSMSASILSSGVCPSTAAALFSLRAVTVLLYVAQFYPPPKDPNRLELELGSKLLRGPGIFMTRAMLAYLPDFAGMRYSLPSAMCWSALVRASATTFHSLRRCAAAMIEDATTDLPYVRTLQKTP